VENLTAMMGDAASNADIARRVLRKYDGDVQKAATAILEGDRGEESIQRPNLASENSEVSHVPHLVSNKIFKLLLF